ncbi:MAG: glycoside hydrolase family 3 protein, partial [Treponema sp.]|nr:glycoside hydrolase family 3 protein [Treponema sp.]
NRSVAEYVSCGSPKSSSEGKVPLVPGGCLFFSFNIAPSAQELASFIDSIHDYCRKWNLLPPYLALDQEGGYVSRLSDIASRLPSQKTVAKRISASKAFELYSIQAKQLASLGFNMNLAPVAEAETILNRDMLQTRTFGPAVETSVYSAACVRAYEQNGIATVLKHFPGNANTDPHTGLPEIVCDDSELDALYLSPFAFILTARPSCVLMSHARLSGGITVDGSEKDSGITRDPKTPACLSSFWVDGVLKNRMGFTGLVMSDDIFMGALAENGFPPEDAAVQAIEAGVHVIMLSEKKFAGVARGLLRHASEDKEFAKKLRAAEKKVLEYKINCGLLEVKKDGASYKICLPSAEKNSTGLKSRIDEFNAFKEKGRAFFKKYFVAGEP